MQINLNKLKCPMLRTTRYRDICNTVSTPTDCFFHLVSLVCLSVCVYVLFCLLLSLAAVAFNIHHVIPHTRNTRPRYVHSLWMQTNFRLWSCEIFRIARTHSPNSRRQRTHTVAHIDRMNETTFHLVVWKQFHDKSSSQFRFILLFCSFRLCFVVGYGFRVDFMIARISR